MPGIEIDCTEPPDFSSAAPSFATAAFDSEGLLESSTIPPRRLTIPLPLANSPAELIQLRKSCCDWAPGALSADSGARTPSSRPLTSKPPAELSSLVAPAPEEVPSEVDQRGEAVERLDVAGERGAGVAEADGEPRFARQFAERLGAGGGGARQAAAAGAVG